MSEWVSKPDSVLLSASSEVRESHDCQQHHTPYQYYTSRTSGGNNSKLTLQDQ